MQGRKDRHTSKDPTRGDRILLLQKLWAAEHTEFEPPLLHAVIYTVVVN
jgi:hypothetical protein